MKDKDWWNEIPLSLRLTGIGKYISQKDVAEASGGRNGNAGDDPLPPLLGLMNSGGFRYLGKLKSPRLLALVSSFNHRDWPDHLDRSRGILNYYGDNREPGTDLHDTGRFGNILLRDVFAKEPPIYFHRLLITAGVQ